MLGKANACLQQAVSFFWTLPYDIYLHILKKFEDIKGVIRSHKLNKDGQYNGQKKKDKQ